jgi:hypothetical protein
MIGAKRKFFGSTLTLLVVLGLMSLIGAGDRGMIVIGPDVALEESGQNAIIGWNGKEEVLILSTDAAASKSTYVLEVLPLPSNPKSVEEGSFESFTKLMEIMDEKLEELWEKGNLGITREGAKGKVEITFHKQIGAHEVTVVKVLDLDYFLKWVDNFTRSKGLRGNISPEFKSTVKSYLDRGIKYFVFDVIDVASAKQSIKPLIYRFKTDYLYYPLEITSTSDAGSSRSTVNLFIVTKGIVDKELIRDVGLWLGQGFDNIVSLSKSELKEVSPELASLFGSHAFVMNTWYKGRLRYLNEDLVAHKTDIHQPTLIERGQSRIEW